MPSDTFSLERDGISCYEVESKYCNKNGYFVTLKPKLIDEAIAKYGNWGVQNETFKVTQEIFNDSNLCELFTISFKKVE